jgi:hypothetical protein
MDELIPVLIGFVAALVVFAVMSVLYICKAHPDYEPDGPTFEQEMVDGMPILFVSLVSGFAAYGVSLFLL